jgi:hypothetical protein
LIATVAGAAGAALLAPGSQTAYTATATIAVDDLALSRMPAIIDTERVLRAGRSSAFADDLSAATGIDAADITAGLRVYSVGVPATQLRVTYTAPAQADAETVGRAAAEELVEVIAEFNAGEMRRQQMIIEQADAVLDAIEQESISDPWERISAVRTVYDMETAKVGAENAVRMIEGAYVLGEDVTSGAAVSGGGRVQSGLGGALRGLLVGCVFSLIVYRARQTA